MRKMKDTFKVPVFDMDKCQKLHDGITCSTPEKPKKTKEQEMEEFGEAGKLPKRLFGQPG